MHSHKCYSGTAWGDLYWTVSAGCHVEEMRLVLTQSNTGFLYWLWNVLLLSEILTAPDVEIIKSSDMVYVPKSQPNALSF